MNDGADDGAPARFLWLPPGLRPPQPMVWRQGAHFPAGGRGGPVRGPSTRMSSASPRPRSRPSLSHSGKITGAGVTVAYFRIAALAALLVAASADLVGRRRLLLLTILGQASFTLLTAFDRRTMPSFVWAYRSLTRVFGYAEEMLCFVVIAEEVPASARGWSNGTMSAAGLSPAPGLASLLFAAVTILCLSAGALQSMSSAARARSSWSPFSGLTCPRPGVSRNQERLFRRLFPNAPRRR